MLQNYATSIIDINDANDAKNINYANYAASIINTNDANEANYITKIPDRG
jgi:hypothetical protein